MADTVHPVFEPIAFEFRLLHARLDRAERHFASFEHTWTGYLDGNPHQLERTTEKDGTIGVRLRRMKPLPIELSSVYTELFDDDLDDVANAHNSARLASNVGKCGRAI